MIHERASETSVSGTGRGAAAPDVVDALTHRAILDALPRAVIVTRSGGEIALWNRAAEELYGWREEEVLGRLIFDILVAADDRELADAVMDQVVSGTTWIGDFTIVRRDGESRRVFAIDGPIFDASGQTVGVVGVSEDVTEHHIVTEQQAADLAARLSLALEAGGFGTWRWDMASGVVEWDAKLEQLFGLSPGEFDGTFDSYVALLHPDDVESTLQTVREATRTKSAYVVDHRVVWPDGSVHWLQGKGRVVLDDAGEVLGTIGCTTDVSEQMHLVFEHERSRDAAVAAAETERLSRERLQFLGEINDALSRSLNEPDLMRNVTATSVPGLGDWCAIFVLDEEGHPIPDVEIAHSDPAMVAHARELQQRFPYDPDAPTGIPAVIRSGESEFYPEIDEQVLLEAAATEEAREVVHSLGLASAIAVPLVKRGKVLGAMQFVNSKSSRSYTEADLALAQAVAARIASTLTNLRLTEHQRRIATTLQASLLPDSLPQIPGLEVAVRYWAAGEGTEVGGDFYDVFDLDDGWAVVIGDVCGSGPEAASLTGLVRHTIRALAWQNAPHDEVLRQVNNAVLRSGRATFCTALFATVTRTSGGFLLEMASGGHPLPILHRGDGRTETVGRPGTLLGAYPDPRSSTVSTKIAAGDTVVLYTDGITDVRPPHDLSTDALMEIVARVSEAADSATDVVRQLGHELSAILPIAKRNDDIAILVLRVPSPA
jgi:PAS domain S-box-containing protein